MAVSKFKYLLLTLVLLQSTVTVRSQDIGLFESIKALQIKQDSFYRSGFFPSQIVRKEGKKIVEDNTIFFTGLCYYTLFSLYPHLTVEQRNYNDSMFAVAQKSFHIYRNRNGGLTYNFYQTHPDNPFPNLRFFSKLDRARLPDDLDDTGIMYLLPDAPQSDKRAIHELMAAQSGKTRKVISTFREYRQTTAYKTWFARKMKQDIDLCVLANILTFVQHNSLAMGSVDSASIRLIVSMVQNNLHIDRPFLASPHYQRSPVILYHLSRLLSLCDDSLLQTIRPRLIADMKHQLQETASSMDKLILISSLYRLGETVDFSIGMNDIYREIKHYAWFRANLMCGKRLWIKKLLGADNMFQFDYASEAYNRCLLLECYFTSHAAIRETSGGLKLVSTVK